MDTMTAEWGALFLFLILFIAAVVVETFWLIRREWASPVKAIAFVILSDGLGLSVGGAVSFLIISVMLALAWDGSLGNVPGKETTQLTALITAAILPFLTFMASKVLFLRIFRIRVGKPAWAFAAMAMLLFSVFVLVPPACIFYFF